MENPLVLPQDVEVANKEKRITRCKLFFQQIEMLIREGSFDEELSRNHVLMRLKEVQFIALYCLERAENEDPSFD